MCTNPVFIRISQGLTLGLALWTYGLSSTAAEVTVTRTNWVDRWITNVIDVSMPRNQFVDQYRTNWVTLVRTNIVTVYSTNWTMEKLTNVVEVAATWTNHVTAYHTNWTPRFLTNLVAVRLVQTNFVERYRTNWSMLDLTNWQTVILLKTNWVTQPVTNVVHINVPEQAAAPAPAAAAPVEPREALVQAAPAAPATSWTGPLVIEAARTATPPADGLVEVSLVVRWSAKSAAPLKVQRWRVEREDASMLFSGQDQEFKRPLPIGKYKVEAKLQGQGSNPPLTARGTLSVTTQEAVVQPRLLVRK
jgi:hypothetical protein